MDRVLLFLTTGFEEMEAIAPIDILRRGGVDLVTVSLTGDKIVEGSHNVKIAADALFEDIDESDTAMLILPGGPGHKNYFEHKGLISLVNKFHTENKLIGAICAAPSLLAVLGFLGGKRIVCHPTVADKVVAAGGELQPGLKVVRDENLITGQAVGASIEFGLELVAALRSRGVSEEMRHGIFY